MLNKFPFDFSNIGRHDKSKGMVVMVNGLCSNDKSVFRHKAIEKTTLLVMIFSRRCLDASQFGRAFPTEISLALLNRIIWKKLEKKN